jgi:hypothetical protein
MVTAWEAPEHHFNDVSYFDMTEGKVWFNFQYHYNQDDIDAGKIMSIKTYLESPLTPVEEF